MGSKKPKGYDIPFDLIKKNKELDQKIKRDPLVKLTNKDYTTEDFIKEVIKQISFEKAKLDAILDNVEDLEPEQVIAINKRKTEIMKQMGDLSITLHKTLAVNEINVKSEGFTVLMEVLFEKLVKALDAARLPEEHKETIFTEFSNELENLEDDYKDKLKSRGMK